MSIQPFASGINEIDPTVDVTANVTNRSAGVGVSNNLRAATFTGEVGRTHDGGLALGYNVDVFPTRALSDKNFAPFVGARLHGAIGGADGSYLAAGGRLGLDYSTERFRAGAFVGIDAGLANRSAKPAGPEVGAYVGLRF